MFLIPQLNFRCQKNGVVVPLKCSVVHKSTHVKCLSTVLKYMLVHPTTVEDVQVWNIDLLNY